MSYEKELLEVAIYQCGKLSPNEEDRLYKWIESLILAKRKADEYEAKAKALDGVKELINAHEHAIEDERGLGHLFLLDLKGIIKYVESGESE